MATAPQQQQQPQKRSTLKSNDSLQRLLSIKPVTLYDELHRLDSLTSGTQHCDPTRQWQQQLEQRQPIEQAFEITLNEESLAKSGRDWAWHLRSYPPLAAPLATAPSRSRNKQGESYRLPNTDGCEPINQPETNPIRSRQVQKKQKNSSTLDSVGWRAKDAKRNESSADEPLVLVEKLIRNRDKYLTATHINEMHKVETIATCEEKCTIASQKSQPNRKSASDKTEKESRIRKPSKRQLVKRSLNPVDEKKTRSKLHQENAQVEKSERKVKCIALKLKLDSSSMRKPMKSSGTQTVSFSKLESTREEKQDRMSVKVATKDSPSTPETNQKTRVAFDVMSLNPIIFHNDDDLGKVSIPKVEKPIPTNPEFTCERDATKYLHEMLNKAPTVRLIHYDTVSKTRKAVQFVCNQRLKLAKARQSQDEGTVRKLSDELIYQAQTLFVRFSCTVPEPLPSPVRLFSLLEWVNNVLNTQFLNRLRSQWKKQTAQLRIGHVKKETTPSEWDGSPFQVSLIRSMYSRVLLASCFRTLRFHGELKKLRCELIERQLDIEKRVCVAKHWYALKKFSQGRSWLRELCNHRVAQRTINLTRACFSNWRDQTQESQHWQQLMKQSITHFETRSKWKAFCAWKAIRALKIVGEWRLLFLQSSLRKYDIGKAMFGWRELTKRNKVFRWRILVEYPKTLMKHKNWDEFSLWKYRPSLEVRSSTVPCANMVVGPTVGSFHSSLIQVVCAKLVKLQQELNNNIETSCRTRNLIEICHQAIASFWRVSHMGSFRGNSTIRDCEILLHHILNGEHSRAKGQPETTTVRIFDPFSCCARLYQKRQLQQRHRVKYVGSNMLVSYKQIGGLGEILQDGVNSSDSLQISSKFRRNAEDVLATQHVVDELNHVKWYNDAHAHIPLFDCTLSELGKGALEYRRRRVMFSAWRALSRNRVNQQVGEEHWRDVQLRKGLRAWHSHTLNQLDAANTKLIKVEHRWLYRMFKEWRQTTRQETRQYLGGTFGPLAKWRMATIMVKRERKRQEHEILATYFGRMKETHRRRRLLMKVFELRETCWEARYARSLRFAQNEIDKENCLPSIRSQMDKENSQLCIHNQSLKRNSRSSNINSSIQVGAIVAAKVRFRVLGDVLCAWRTYVTERYDERQLQAMLEMATIYDATHLKSRVLEAWKGIVVRRRQLAVVAAKLLVKRHGIKRDVFRAWVSIHREFHAKLLAFTEFWRETVVAQRAFKIWRFFAVMEKRLRIEQERKSKQQLMCASRIVRFRRTHRVRNLVLYIWSERWRSAQLDKRRKLIHSIHGGASWDGI